MSDKTIITKNVYSISKIKKLIDLNHNMINFKVRFILTSNQPFYALIVDQDTLDTTDNLQYKYVEDRLSGEIISDKNTYQNYYIILKSDKPTNVDVELHTIHLPDLIQPPSQVNINEVQPIVPETKTTPPPSKETYQDVAQYEVKNTYYFYIFIIVIGIIGFLYFTKYNQKTISTVKRVSLLEQIKKL
jgi:hypothetical protein